MRAQASSYGDRPNAVLGNMQSRGEYLGGYRVHVGDDSHSVFVAETASNEERAGFTQCPQGDGDVVEAPSLAGPS